MGLRLVYGRSGTGKSQFCFDEISKLIDNNKIFIITPEQFSFTAEKKLLEAVNRDSAINGEVLTFERMAYRAMQIVGGGIKPSLTSCGKSILISDILNLNSESLKFLGKTDKNIELVSNMITELRKHNISENQIENVVNNTKDKYLKYKLEDINVFYKEFKNRIRDNFIDEEDVLSKLYEKIDRLEFLDNSLIYIDEFVGFTPQEYLIIEKLLKKAKRITITINTDSIIESNNPDADIFYTSKKTASKIIDIAKNIGAKIEKNIYLDKQYRFKSGELQHLEKNIYNLSYEAYDKVPKDISLFLAKNQYFEVDYIAKNIIGLVRDSNYRYKDISVITKNIETYSGFIKAIFPKYGIPVFIDEKKDINQNILIKYLVSILEIFSTNWSYEAMFNYIKTGFLSNVSQEEIFNLEEFCIKWGIKGSKWYNERWTYGLENESEIDIINDIKDRIVQPLLKFKNSLNKRKTVEEITKSLYNFLLENNIDSKLEEKAKYLEDIGQIDLANTYITCWNVVLNIFDEMIMVLGDKYVSFDKYFNLLKVGFSNSKLGKIPATLDEVTVGDVDRSRSHKTKAVFIIGLNDGVFPNVNADEGFLDDVDRENLTKEGLELAKTTKEKLYDDNFNIYKAFTTAEEKLYLTYSSADSEGKSLRPSNLILKIKKVFPKICEISDIVENYEKITTLEGTFEDLLSKIKSSFENNKPMDDKWVNTLRIFLNNPDWRVKLQNAIEGMNYTNIAENIDKENIAKLYGDTLKTSVSRLEQYRACPFSYYLKYGLKLSEKEEFKIKSLDTGSFMHDIIDTFFNNINEEKYLLKELSYDEIYKMIDDIIDDKLKLNRNYIFNSTPRFLILTNRLRRLIKLSMKYIVDTVKQSSFNVLDTEVEFGKNEYYKPLVIELEEGKKVEITGKIDRIDVAEDEEGKFIRIIDYKSSIKDIDLNQVVSGLQIQLLTYLDAITEKENATSAGILYFNLIEPVIKATKNLTDEELEKELRKKFKMQGLVLANLNVIKMMDNNLEKGASEIIPVYIDKEENISTGRSSTVSKEEFIYLQKYIKKVIKDISEEILKGNIVQNPYYSIKNHKTPCEYCSYKSICGFNPNLCGNNYNYIPNKNKQEILNNISNLIK